MAAEPIWYFARESRQHGPVPVDVIHQMLSRGELSTTDLVWCEGMTQWTAAGRVPALAVVTPPNAPVGGMPHLATPHAPGGYGARPLSYTQAATSYSGMAVAGLVMAFIMPLVGFILTLVAMNGMKRTGNYDGKGIANAAMAICVGWFALLFVIFCVLVGAFVASTHVH